MRNFKILVLLFISSLFVNCAATYSKINPKTIYYQSKNSVETVTLEYKYDLLNKKYKKKELKNNIKLVAIKLTNNSEKDYVFGNDMNLV